MPGQKLGAIGFDFGGSHFGAAIVDSSGNFISEIFENKIDNTASAAMIIEVIGEVLSHCFGAAKQLGIEILGIGGGSPGPLDTSTFTLSKEAVNLPTLRGVCLGKPLAERFGLDILVENDANLFVYGEAWFGAARNQKNQPLPIVLGCTLGTGFGCGLVVNGEIFKGANGMAMEHAKSILTDKMVVEDIISTKGVSHLYQDIFKTKDSITPQEVSALARANDLGAKKVWQHFGLALGQSLSWLINAVDPNIVVIGGGISNNSAFFLEYVKQVVDDHSLAHDKNYPIVISELKDRAIIKGGAKLVFSQQNIK